MIDKILEYLNWLYVGIGATILTFVGWLFAMSAKSYAVKSTTLFYQDEMRKLSESAAEKAVEKVLVSEALKKRDNELLASLTNIVANGLAQYPPLVRKEAVELLAPIIKSNKINQTKIAKIEKSLKEHRESEHKHRHDTLTVLNFLIDSINETTKNADKIVELQRKISSELNERQEYININAS